MGGVYQVALNRFFYEIDTSILRFTIILTFFDILKCIETPLLSIEHTSFTLGFNCVSINTYVR